jgi:molybdopterin molybdotransferase
MISVEAALSAILERAPLLAAERVPLRQALGRVLREDVCADVDLPPFDRSAMDGFALRSADTARGPVALRITGERRAGQAAGAALEPGCAVRIMTGAPVPPGADAVEPVEKARVEAGERVVVSGAVAPGAHVAPRGTEARAGERVLQAGTRIDPAAVGLLATVGCAEVTVGARPRVALLVTGDELVDVPEKPGPGQIRNANGYALEQQVLRAGGDPRCLGIAPDRADALAAAMEPGFEADVLLVSGGVSAGEYDLVEDVFSRFGVQVAFDAVAVKPGKPLVFGWRGSSLVFGLPGNPVSAQVTFDLFVRPALSRMQGQRSVARPTVAVETRAPLVNRSRRRAHLPARVRLDEERLVADPVPSRGSADVVAHARANALLVLAAEQVEVAAGTRVPALLLDSFLDGWES